MTDETKQPEAQAEPTPIEPEGEAADVAGTEPALTNGAASEAQGALEAKLEELRDCAGIAGRDPQPQGGSYCE